MTGVGEGEPGSPDAHQLVEVQAALRRVAAIAAGGEPPEAVFAAVSAEAAAMLGGALVAVTAYERAGTESVVVAQTGDHVPLGARLPVAGAGLPARMWRSCRPERIDDYGAVAAPDLVEKLGVRAAVAVPVLVDGRLWGALSVSSRTGPLPAGTEDRLAVFAEIVAAAVVGLEARRRVRLLADEQAAVLRVAALVARGAPEAEIFDAVAVEGSRLIDDEATTLVRYEGHRTFTVLAHRRGLLPVGARYTVPVDDAGTSAEMLRTLRPARRDRYDGIADRSFSNRDFGVGSSVSVPIMVNGRLWGSLGTLNEGRRLPAYTEARLATFAELVGSALANVAGRAALERFGDEQAALRRVAELAAGGVPYPQVLRGIVGETADLFDDAVVSVAEAGTGTVAGTWHRVEVAGSVTDGRSIAEPSPGEDAVVRRVLATGEPAHTVDDPTAGPDAAPFVRGVGVPVRVEGRTWGALVVTGGLWSLPQGTEDRLAQFAHVAATAITAARSRDALGKLAREQAALRRVAELVARGVVLDEVFDAVATEASTILRGLPAALSRYDADGFSTVVGECRFPAPVGLRIPTDPKGVRETGGPVRFSSLAGTAYADSARAAGATGLVAVPVTVEGRIWGNLSTVTTGTELPPADAEDRLAEFAALAAAAIANAENRAKLRASRARVVATADEVRQRLQRDVHDGAQQRLVQTVLALRLGLAAADRSEAATDLMREALLHAERATVELRDIVHGILPAALSRGGLGAGLDSLLAVTAVPVDLDADGLPDRRLPGEVEVTGYFVVAEALTNVVKHARASRARVTVALTPGSDGLVVEVADDGVGGADRRRGSGLTGLADRVDALDGTLSVTSVAGAGTTVRVTLPLSGR